MSVSRRDARNSVPAARFFFYSHFVPDVPAEGICGTIDSVSIPWESNPSCGSHRAALFGCDGLFALGLRLGGSIIIPAACHRIPDGAAVRHAWMFSWQPARPFGQQQERIPQRVNSVVKVQNSFRL